MQHGFSVSSNQEVLNEKMGLLQAPCSVHPTTVPPSAAGLLLALLWVLPILLLTTAPQVCLDRCCSYHKGPHFLLHC